MSPIMLCKTDALERRKTYAHLTTLINKKEVTTYCRLIKKKMKRGRAIILFHVVAQ
jgi:hypothetical protein